MATFTPRTVDEIFTDMLDEKNTYSSLDVFDNQSITDEQTFLDSLDSTSLTAIWILLFYLVSRFHWAEENIMLSAISEMETIRDSSQVHNKAWYIYKALLYQYGDALIVTDGVPAYETIDTSKYVISHCSAEEINGKLQLKIRGKSSNLLTEDELNGFQSYIDEIQDAGSRINIKNADADLIKLVATVKYNGEYSVNDIQTAVESAINTYISTLPYDSLFIKNDLIESVKSIAGIYDFEINTLEAKPNTGTYTQVIHNYKTDAGYCSIDSNYPLSTFLTYIIK